MKNFLSFPLEFEILIQQLSETDRQQYKQKIEKFTSQCRCKSGQLFLALFLLLSIILCIFSIMVPTKFYIINFLVFAFFGAAIGKILGLIKAGIGLKKIIQEIEYKLLNDKDKEYAI